MNRKRRPDKNANTEVTCVANRRAVMMASGGLFKMPKMGKVAFVECPVEVTVAFEAGIKFGIEHSGAKPKQGWLHAGTSDPRWTPDEWRTALKNAWDNGSTSRDLVQGLKDAAKAGK